MRILALSIALCKERRKPRLRKTAFGRDTFSASIAVQVSPYEKFWLSPVCVTWVPFIVITLFLVPGWYTPFLLIWMVTSNDE